VWIAWKITRGMNKENQRGGRKEEMRGEERRGEKWFRGGNV
jgi:hypothetical protein